MDTSEDILIIPDSSLHLAPLGELGEVDGFETDVSFDDQYCTLVESKDTFSEEHSLDELFDVEFSDIAPLDELSEPISKSSIDLDPSPSILLLFFSLSHSSFFFRPS